MAVNLAPKTKSTGERAGTKKDVGFSVLEKAERHLEGRVGTEPPAETCAFPHGSHLVSKIRDEKM